MRVSAAAHRRPVTRFAAVPGHSFGKQCANLFLDTPRAGVTGVGFAHVQITNNALFVDQIERRPVTIAQRLPVSEVIVHHHRVLQPEFTNFSPDTLGIALVVEFGAVDTDYLKGLISEVGFQHLQPRKGAIAVPAIESPNIDQQNLAFQLLGRQRRAVEPMCRVASCECRERSLL